MLTKTLAAAAVLALLAGCNKPAEPRADRPTPSPSSGASQTQPNNVPTTPANTPAPSSAEKKEGANPVQGQVDPKESAQQKDFKQPGDSAGPKGPDTQPPR